MKKAENNKNIPQLPKTTLENYNKEIKNKMQN